MNKDCPDFMNLQVKPAVVGTREAAWILGVRDDWVPILVGACLLKVVGGHQSGCQFFFASATLMELASDVPGVRAVVAARVEDRAILEKLAFDECSEVRSAAMENPHTPSALANRVARADKDMRIVAKAAARVDDPALLDELAEKCTQADLDLIRAIVKNPNSSDAAKAFAVLIRWPD